MKRVVSAFLALAVSAALVFVTSWKHGVTPVHAQGGCSVATLAGNYAFSYTGFAAPAHSPIGGDKPIAAVGVFTFDGTGSFSETHTLAFANVISTDQTSSGTYTVNSDCTGSISFTAGAITGFTTNIVIIGGGTEVFGIGATRGFTVTVDAKKQ